MDLWTYEREQWNSGLTALCGVDEAGAGPLAGPVYAAAVILPREIGFPGLNDSKKLTAKKRNVLFDQITATAEAYSIAFVTAEEIDRKSTRLNSSHLVISYAVFCLKKKNRVRTSSGSLFYVFFFNDTATTEIYTLSLHDALPIYLLVHSVGPAGSG